MVTYGEVDKIRKEAGDLDEEDVTNEDIEEAIEATEVIINNYTQHEWNDTEKSWSLVKQITKLIASSLIMDSFDDPKGEVEKNFNKGMLLLEMLTTSDEVSNDVNIAVTEYQTQGKNPNAPVTRYRLYATMNGVTGEDQLLEQASL